MIYFECFHRTEGTDGSFVGQGLLLISPSQFQEDNRKVRISTECHDKIDKRFQCCYLTNYCNTIALIFFVGGWVKQCVIFRRSEFLDSDAQRVYKLNRICAARMPLTKPLFVCKEKTAEKRSFGSLTHNIMGPRILYFGQDEGRKEGWKDGNNGHHRVSLLSCRQVVFLIFLFLPTLITSQTLRRG